MTPLESKVRELVGRILYGGPAVRDCEKKDVDEATTAILALIEGEVRAVRYEKDRVRDALEKVYDELYSRDECVFCGATDFSKHQNHCELELAERTLSSGEGK